MKQLLREPLLHFLLIGAGLFLLYESSNKAEEEPGDDQIVVTAGRIQQLVTVFEKAQQKPPNEVQLKSLIDEYVLEEACYRQAVAMGIDRDDTFVRRRLRQKFEFLTEDAVGLIEPSENELENFLANNAEAFRLPATYTFRHIYFSPSRHGDNPEEYVKGQLELVRNGDESPGDPTLMPEAFADASVREVDGLLGLGFAQKLDERNVGEWSGPILSGVGLHLVRVDQRQEGELPELDAIRTTVEREWRSARQAEMRQDFNQKLLDQYEVVIEWPESSDPEEASGE